VRSLVSAFIDARLFGRQTTDDTAEPPMVRLAHEALISRWKRAQDQIAADRRDLETRALIERQVRTLE